MKNFIKKYYIAIISVLIYFILKFYNPQIFPDLLNLSSVSSSNYFGLLISSTTSIFGILIAIILLAFGFVKQISFRRKGENILSKGVVTNPVSIAITIIILSLISYSSNRDLKQYNNLSIAYFLGFLYAVFIVSIFPAAKKILETANTLKNIKNEIENLSLSQFEEILALQDSRFISKNNNIALVRIRYELLNAVRECDYEAYTTILEVLNNKAIELIGKGENCKVTEIVFRGISFIWCAGNFEALRVGNYQFYETIWECLEELYEYAAKKKIYLLHYEFIYFFIRDFVNFLSRNKLGDSLSSGVKVLSNIFKKNLKFNCPPQEEIPDLYFMFEEEYKFDHFTESSIQWENIIDFISLINDIQTSAMKNADKEMFNTCRFGLDDIINDIGSNYFPELKIYQEAFIVCEITYNQTYNGYCAKDENLLKEPIQTFRIDTIFISGLIEKEKFYVKRILEDISDFLIKSQRKKRLDNYSSLNYWGALGRHISKFYMTKKIAQEAMEFILETLYLMKKEIEENQLPDQSCNYYEIKKQLNSIKSWLLKSTVKKETPIIEKISKILAQFKDVTENSDFIIVKWKKEGKST